MGSRSVFPSNEFGEVFGGSKSKTPFQTVGIKGNFEFTAETQSEHFLRTKDISEFESVIYNSAENFWDKEFFEHEPRVGLELDVSPNTYNFMFKSKNESPFTIIVFY